MCLLLKNKQFIQAIFFFDILRLKEYKKAKVDVLAGIAAVDRLSSLCNKKRPIVSSQPRADIFHLKGVDVSKTENNYSCC